MSKQTDNNTTVYDVKSHGVIVEFTRSIKDAEEAFAASAVSPNNKAIYALSNSGQKRRIK